MYWNEFALVALVHLLAVVSPAPGRALPMPLTLTTDVPPAPSCVTVSVPGSHPTTVGANVTVTTVPAPSATVNAVVSTVYSGLVETISLTATSDPSSLVNVKVAVPEAPVSTMAISSEAGEIVTAPAPTAISSIAPHSAAYLRMEPFVGER